MKIVSFSNSFNLDNLRKNLEEASLPWPIVLCDQDHYEKFSEVKQNFLNYNWIFYGSRDFINSVVFQEKSQKNLLAVVVSQENILSWTSFVNKLKRTKDQVKLVASIEINKQQAQKYEALNFLEEKIDSYTMPPRLRRHLMEVADELLMNALYDAPYSQEKGHIYEQTPRHISEALAKPVTLELYESKDSLRVAVTDCYGSLNKDKTIYRLSKSFVSDSYISDESRAGAGIGLAQSFKKGANLNFYCNPNKQTTVEASFHIADSYREYLLNHKFIIFNFEEAAESLLLAVG